MVLSNHVARLMLIASTLAASWLAMQVVHELGHVIAAWLTGGTVTNVVLHPLAISRTDFAPNPRPNIVVWGGPVMGCLLPLLAWSVARTLHATAGYLWRFFAGFCCVANGAYIGTGVIFPVGDAQVMLATGTPGWGLALIGITAVPLGLWLWNGLGREFGIGRPATSVNPRHAIGMLALCVGIVVIELLFA